MASCLWCGLDEEEFIGPPKPRIKHIGYGIYVCPKCEAVVKPIIKIVEAILLAKGSALL